MLSEDPFGSKNEDIPLKMETYAPFPFLPDISPADYGGTFEFRTYHLKPGGLPGTMAGWEKALDPAHAYTSHLVINMYALDGEPRILHIWGFSSVEERNRLRWEHYAAGLWPPEGGPERIAHATSVIAYSEPNLPIVQDARDISRMRMAIERLSGDQLFNFEDSGLVLSLRRLRKL